MISDMTPLKEPKHIWKGYNKRIDANMSIYLVATCEQSDTVRLNCMVYTTNGIFLASCQDLIKTSVLENNVISPDSIIEKFVNAYIYYEVHMSKIHLNTHSYIPEYINE